MVAQVWDGGVGVAASQVSGVERAEGRQGLLAMVEPPARGCMPEPGTHDVATEGGQQDGQSRGTPSWQPRPTPVALGDTCPTPTTLPTGSASPHWCQWDNGVSPGPVLQPTPG